MKRTGKSQLIFAACVFLWNLFAADAFCQKHGQERTDSLESVLPALRDDTNKVKLLTSLSFEYKRLNPEKGVAAGSQALALATRLRWKKGMADADNCLGLNCYALSDYQRALNYYFNALAINQKIGSNEDAAANLSNIGNVYMVLGNYPKALEYDFKSLNIAEQHGYIKRVAANLSNIGAIYSSETNYSKALEYFFKALEINEENGYKEYLAVNLQNIGNIYQNQAKYPEALKHDFRALEVFKAIGDKSGIADIIGNIGIVCRNQNNLKQALGYTDTSLKLHRELGDKYGSANNLGNIGVIYLSMARTATSEAGRRAWVDSAIKYLHYGISAFAEIGSTNDEVVEFRHFLPEAFALTGDYKKAFASYKEYEMAKDSVFSADNKVTIANLETTREMDLNDKQAHIEKLEVVNKRDERIFFVSGFILLFVVTIIVYRNMRLATAKELSENRLSAFQARMNPHFIFNSLNSIQYLVLNKETERSMDYLSEFSKLMRQVLDNSARSKVFLTTEIEMLESYLHLENLRFDFFKWTIEVAADVNPVAVEIPGMIVQPFVENAILHGIAPMGENGRINIRFERDEQHIICTVDDNGIGRAKSSELNRGKNKNRQSHGVSIATNRLTLLNDKRTGLVNKITYVDKMDNGVATGTTVIIQIPIL